MADPALRVGMILFALFGLPKIMAYIPDFDPLVAIICLFAGLAALQHLGLVAAAEGPEPGDRFGRGGSRRDDGGRSDFGRGGNASDTGRPAEDPLKEAAVCLEQNNYSRARDLAKGVTDSDPENARAWEILVTALKWEGKRDEALETLKKASDLYEVKSEGLTKLLKELEGAGNPGAAAAEYEKKGEEFLGRRQYDLALDCLSKAIEALGGNDASIAATPEGLRLLRRRAECAQQLQDWSLCRSDATAILEAEPEDTKALLQRAASNEALEKFKAALEDARKLLTLDPRSAAANRIVHNCNQALRD
eukprot:TRINITY_DN47222_c0_g1_i1.p1 TRINITY_DN47222_c0_g1~~TRINITY_DN47222_c0_g1_i1.p1  ORF type:complete len:306 (+),score=71.95 TRINITY_DN47222_c0_g1_i1:196-1113(+)